MSNNQLRSEWEGCKPGELQQLSRRLQARARREKLLHVAQGSAWTLLLVAVGVFFVGFALSNRTPGGITCAECIAHFDEYQSYLIAQKDLDPDVVQQIVGHLEGCHRCRTMFELRYPGLRERQTANIIGVNDGPPMWFMAQAR